MFFLHSEHLNLPFLDQDGHGLVHFKDSHCCPVCFCYRANLDNRKYEMNANAVLPGGSMSGFIDVHKVASEVCLSTLSCG